jgi:cell division protein ZapA (FtsZ GTPase activity inhibitor)
MGLQYEIQVRGYVFQVSSDKGEEHVRRIAQRVAQRMHELAAAGTTADSARLAIMTALTFAEEATGDS